MSDLQIQFSPHQNPSAFPYGNGKENLKIHREEQESQIVFSQIKNVEGGSSFQGILQNHRGRNSIVLV